MRTKILTLLLIQTIIAFPNEPMSLELCRDLALANNKQLRIGAEKVKQAEFRKSEALSAYLPALDIEGSYVYNQKDISLFDRDKYPLLEKILPKNFLSYDTHNLFAGAVTITQPVFVGGKIIALNKMASIAKSIAHNEQEMIAQDIIYGVDVAYWQIVSLKAKAKVAQEYVNLLDTLSHNVNLMIKQGVATRSDALSIEVKYNAAKVDMTKVENGLTLSRMWLAQMCGLPVDSVFTLQDEDVLPEYCFSNQSSYNINEVYRRRNDVQALTLAVDIYNKKADVERASMLPQIAVIGAYSASNPNIFNGFKNKFDGMFSVGATVKIPVWHWGGNYYKYKVAKSDAVIATLNLEDAKSKIALQVREATFKMLEAEKALITALSNEQKAKENLRIATIGFNEGVITSSNVMEAQTAWLNAQSQLIDSCIDVKLCDVYLKKVFGTLSFNL